MGNSSTHAASGAFVSPRLLAAAHTSPNRVFHVIVQGSGVRGEAQAVSAVHAAAWGSAAWGWAASADVAADSP